jgi:hypothetical protein
MSKLKELFDKVEATEPKVHFKLERVITADNSMWRCQCGISESLIVWGETPEEAIEKALERRQKYIEQAWNEYEPVAIVGKLACWGVDSVDKTYRDSVEHAKESLFTRPISD